MIHVKIHAEKIVNNIRSIEDNCTKGVVSLTVYEEKIKREKRNSATTVYMRGWPGQNLTWL